MAKKTYTTLERSNRAHYRLWHKYGELLENVSVNSPKEKRYSILNYYHNSIYLNQSRSNRLMSKDEKKKTYLRTVKKFNKLYSKYS